MGFCEIICGDLGRSSVFILCAGGIICSYFALRSCEFFQYKSNDPSILPGPYLGVSEGYVGLFYHYDYSENPDSITGNNGDCSTLYTKGFFLIGSSQSSVFNTLFQIAQLCAIIGPSAAIISWTFNVIEWCCCKLKTTFFLTFGFLFVGFVGQGLTFMIYGQTEFCFNDAATESCNLGIGAILSICAAGAFYLASVIWCCMPRSMPLMKRRRPKDDNINNQGTLDYYETQTNPNNNNNGDGENNNNVESGGSVVPDRDEVPDAEVNHSWQNYEKPSFQNGNSSGSSSTRNNAAMGSSQQQQQSGATLYYPDEQQQQQQSGSAGSGSYHDYGQPPPSQQQRQHHSNVSEDDFENPFLSN